MEVVPPMPDLSSNTADTPAAETQPETPATNAPANTQPENTPETPSEPTDNGGTPA